ncbi:hypothetical protein MNEG_7175 [Monoraphidium neglectum]|uniref:Uncharacterized protein n=1 Tax=Monoraphidium neglectum TaxID=145388 RepID=A0A0D2L024_9CHLO|nr:hypothetical protein MNEG_7175 [Monoraphidium neglectum]KIZ00784.1 hypothetical protein MNEG_7175 [Monoraphidium neglectum]|eukprot:XP_013899803.1 hypothetical protein MNEG_7175 [Monoraphidium neglectum]
MPGVENHASEAHLAASAGAAACTFSPATNAASERLLAHSREIPSGFMERQRYFEALRTEKMLLLQLAAEDKECRFTAPKTPRAGPTASPRGARERQDTSWVADDVGGGTPHQGYLDRIERVASADKRRADARRDALAAHLLAAQCTFSPEICPRSRTMARNTPLEVRGAAPPLRRGVRGPPDDELSANSRGRARRAAAAAEVAAAREAECTFAPDLSKGAARHAPQLAITEEASRPPRTQQRRQTLAFEGPPLMYRQRPSRLEAQDLVDRLYSAAAIGAPSGAAPYRSARTAGVAAEAEYSELLECTFEPNARGRPAPVPQPRGPVLIKGLGRFLELQDMARRQRQEQEALEARVFMKSPRPPQAPFTRPEPFRLATGGAGRDGAALEARAGARRARAEREAAAAAFGDDEECADDGSIAERSAIDGKQGGGVRGRRAWGDGDGSS